MRIPTVKIRADNRAGYKIINADDPRALSRDGIAMAEKDRVIELIEAHGVDPDGRWSVDRLRAQLIAIMFVDA